MTSLVGGWADTSPVEQKQQSERTEETNSANTMMELDLQMDSSNTEGGVEPAQGPAWRHKTPPCSIKEL